MRHYSNTMRKKQYKRTLTPDEAGSLDTLISLDAAGGRARAGAKMTMEQLVTALLPHGVVPAVVPEFKGITVGGAINGAAIESSSHRFGQFNDCCSSYEVLTGKGLLKASPNEHAELFYGLAGSYGSLGSLLNAEFKILPTTGWVEVQYRLFHSLEEAIHELAAFQGFGIEGIVFSPTHVVLVSAREVSEEKALRLPSFSLRSYGSNWFYAHAAHKAQPGDGPVEAMRIDDYFFRHDRGAFWMAGYSLSPSILMHYWMHKVRLCLTGRDEGIQQPLSHAKPGIPSSLFRFAFGWLLDSQWLYSSLHGGSEEWFENKFVIQDYYIPLPKAKGFVDNVLESYKITPLWLCPVKATQTPQLFSPHVSLTEKLFVNVGVYGIPFQSKGPDAVRQLEKWAEMMGGKKMLYCQTYYSPEDFWKLYPEGSYRGLRTLYGSDGMFAEITDKVLSR